MLPSRPRHWEVPRSPEPRPELRLVPRENRVAVLLNANAKRVTSRVQKTFERIVPAGDLFFSRTPKEAEAFAEEIIHRRYSTVLAGGGDGTIVMLMNLLLRAATAASRPGLRHTLPDLGILKLGTGNGLAVLSGAGEPAKDALRAVAGERTIVQPLRLVEDVASGWVFPFCSMGYDAQVLNDHARIAEATTSPMGKSLAKSLGGYFYALATRTIPHELASSRAQVRIVATGRASMLDPETDEEVPLQNGATLFEGTARSVSAATSPFYGFGMRIHPFADRRSDRFQLRISTASINYLLARLPSLWKGTLRSPQVLDFLVESVRIETSVPMPLQYAGDAGGERSTLELRLSDRAFRLLGGSARRPPS